MNRAFLVASSLVATSALVLATTTALAAPRQASSPAAAKSGYHVVEKHKLGGDGGWDYLTVDSAAKRVYVSRSSHVMVVDAEKGTLVGDVPNTDGVHGIAIASEFKVGFTSNGRSDDSTVFDLDTLKEVGRVKTGKGPDAILYEPTTKRVFTFNGHAGSATAIDAAKREVAGTVELGGQPEFGVADGKGHVYVNLEDKSEIVEIDAAKLTVLNHWTIAPGEEPSGLAIDAKNRRLFSGCGNQKMVVVDADSGKVVANVAIGKGVDACGFDPDTGCAFASNGDGTLTVVHEDAPDKFTVLENVPTQVRSKTMALDPKTHRVYLGAAEFEAQPAPGQRRPNMVAGSFALWVVAKQ